MRNLFNKANYIRILVLSTCLSLSQTTLASSLDEDMVVSSAVVSSFKLLQEEVQQLGNLAILPVEIIGKIFDVLGPEESHMKIAMANSVMFKFITESL